MDGKLEYELSKQLEKPSLTKISTKAMAIWRETQEDTELYNMVKDLIDTIDNEQKKLDDVRSMLYLVVGKL